MPCSHPPVPIHNRQSAIRNSKSWATSPTPSPRPSSPRRSRRPCPSASCFSCRRRSPRASPPARARGRTARCRWGCRRCAGWSGCSPCGRARSGRRRGSGARWCASRRSRGPPWRRTRRRGSARSSPRASRGGASSCAMWGRRCRAGRRPSWPPASGRWASSQPRGPRPCPSPPSRGSCVGAKHCELIHNMRKISESTVRRLSLYLRFLEQFAAQGQATVSSAELARRSGTTSAQVRKDLSFFGSFGKRGLGYSVPALAAKIRDILGLRRTYRVVLVGAGRIGGALVQYPGFRQRGFHVAAIYDKDPKKVGTRWDGLVVRDVRHIETDLAKEPSDIAIVVTPAESAQDVTDRLVRAGVKAILNFAPVQLQVPPDVAVKSVNMALELETLSFALANR